MLAKSMLPSAIPCSITFESLTSAQHAVAEPSGHSTASTMPGSESARLPWHKGSRSPALTFPLSTASASIANVSVAAGATPARSGAIVNISTLMSSPRRTERVKYLPTNIEKSLQSLAIECKLPCGPVRSLLIKRCTEMREWAATQCELTAWFRNDRMKEPPAASPSQIATSHKLVRLTLFLYARTETRPHFARRRATG